MAIQDLEDRIIYEDDKVLIVNKPHDIPTSGKNLDDDDALQYWLMKREESMIWAVHQLDADTTGVNIFVKQKKLVGKYQKALAHKDSKKRYLIVVHGVPNWKSISCTEPIGKVDDRSLGVTPEGKYAESHFTLLDSSQRYSLIESYITTGRTHQIRIHLSHLGFPLVGEEWYRDTPCLEHPRQALHAESVILSSPINETYTATLALDFIKLCRRVELTIE